VYEQYGNETLISGVIGPDNVRRGGYAYKQNCYEIFDKFFLDQNPFAEIIDTKGVQIEGSYFGTAFGGLNEVLPEPMTDISATVACSLKDFFCGVKKTVTF
jgi:DnaJ-class molecular chaperone